MQDKIVIKGARENNLKNIDVEIPRDKLVVLTGLSGSGKSSLAFDDDLVLHGCSPQFSLNLGPDIRIMKRIFNVKSHF